jgi:hypothetical protein
VKTKKQKTHPDNGHYKTDENQQQKYINIIKSTDKNHVKTNKTKNIR